MNRHVWVIEMRDEDGEWRPCADCALTKRDARGYNKLRQWQENNPSDKFRITQYVRPIP